MTIQGVMDGAGALLLALGGFVLNGLKSEQTEQRVRHERLAVSLPETYARRDDVKALGDELKGSLRRIEDRLGTTPHDHH